jgi:WD40 repeat protein
MRRWKAHRGKIASLSFSRDGRLLASVTGSGRDVFIWDAATGELARKLTVADVEGKHSYARAHAVAFAPDADVLAVVRYEWVEAWETVEWRRIGEVPTWVRGGTDEHPPIGIPYEVAVGPGESPLIAVSSAHSVLVWARPPLEGEQLQLVASWRVENISQVSFSHDGTRAATHTTRHVQIHDPANGQELKRVAHNPANYGGPVRFSPDSSRLAFCYTKTIESHPATLDDPTAVIRYAGHTNKVWALRNTPDGRSLVSASSDGTVRVWEAATGLQTRCFEMNVGKMLAADVSPDGTMAAVGGATGEIVVWDLE